MSFSDRLFSGRGGELAKPTFGTLFPGNQMVAIFLIAVLFRWLYWSLAADSAFMHTPVVDGSFFDIWARTLAEGRVFQAQPFFKPPLYAYLLSFLYRMGLDMQGVIALQMIVGAISCVLTLAVARTVFSSRVAFSAAIVMALLPILPFFESQLQAESWTLALTLGSLLPVLLVISGRTRPRAKWLFVAGALLGIAALGRPNLMLQVVVLAAGLWWWGRSGGRLGLTGILPLLVGFVLAISPATMHNLKHGEFVLISANLGVNLYTGQSDAADGVSAIPVGVLWDDILLRSQQEGAASPAASSRLLTGETLRWMGKNPGQTLALWLKKAVLVCNGVEGRNNINPMWLARQDGVVVLARWWPATWLMLPFTFVGLIWAGRSSAPAWLLKWVLLSQALAILPFFVNARFRAPLLPLLALFAAAGLVELVRAVRARRWLPVAVLLVAAVFVNIDWYGLDQERWLARDHFNQGLIASRAYDGRTPDIAQAAAHFQHALDLEPNDVDFNERYGALALSQAQPLVTQGLKLAESGQAQQAEQAFARADHLLSMAEKLHSKAAEVFPRSYRSWGNLGICQMWLADIQAARARLSLAAGQEKPAAALAVDALAKYTAATTSLQTGLRVNRAQPDSRRHSQLIWNAVLELPDIDPAISRMQQQLRQRMGGNQ